MPKLACPRCFHTEIVVVERPFREWTDLTVEDGTICVREASEIIIWEPPDGTHLGCVYCDHLFPVPDGFTIQFV